MSSNRVKPRSERFQARVAFGAVFVLACAAALAAESPARADGGHLMSHAELAHLVRVCAPQVNGTTQAAIVAVESGGDPWALHDDNDDTVYSPASLREAVTLAGGLIARDRRAYGSQDRGLDVGLAQINSSNFTALHVGVAEMLDPCANLRASAQVIVTAYLHEREILASDPSAKADQMALRRALQVYNSGKSSGDDAYVRAIFGSISSTLVRDVGGATPVNVVTVAATPSAKPLRFPGYDPAIAALSRGVARGNVGLHRNAATSRRRDEEPPLRSAVFAHVDVEASPSPTVTQNPPVRVNSPSDGASFVHEATTSPAPSVP